MTRFEKTMPVIGIFAIVFMTAFSSMAGVANRSSFDKIDDAYQAGTITESDMLFDKMTALYAPQKLADQFRTASFTPFKCGTELVQEVQSKWSLFTPDQRAVLSQYLARPSTQVSYDTPDGFFKIHYDTSGPEVVPLEDKDSNGIPDYVDRIAVYCDSARRAYLNMGYLPAVTDGVDGGDGRFDIYLLSIGGCGITIPEAAGDSSWNDYSAYIQIHRNFYGFGSNNDPEGDTIGLQKVTCVHEYFHAIQLAYNLDADRWWMEASATWMEEVLYPIVQDNHSYLPYFLGVPQTRLIQEGDYHQYGAFVWPGFLQQKYDYTIIRKVLEENRYVSTLNALDSALASQNESVGQIFPEFAVWNYYTGTRAKSGMYYAQAESYSSVPVDLTYSTLKHDSIQPVNRPDGLGCNYISFAVDSTARGILEMRLEGSPLSEWALTVIASRGSHDSVVTKFNSNNGPVKVLIPFIDDYDQVVAIPTAVSLYPQSVTYYLSTVILSYGDANYDGRVNVGDVTYIINRVFKNGPAPKPVWQSGDANCDGSVNVGDAVHLINYVFKGGLPPCSNR